MFKDAKTTCTNLDSSWKSNKEPAIDSTTQTFTPKITSSSNQSIELENAAVQTASISKTTSSSSIIVDNQILGSFLQKVEKDISKSLLDNIKSTAFQST
jgi:hypothetical protein